MHSSSKTLKEGIITEVKMLFGRFDWGGLAASRAEGDMLFLPGCFLYNYTVSGMYILCSFLCVLAITKRFLKTENTK